MLGRQPLPALSFRRFYGTSPHTLPRSEYVYGSAVLTLTTWDHMARIWIPGESPRRSETVTSLRT